MSLWQGVDVPGDACQLVLIDRLPFPPPHEPPGAPPAGAPATAGAARRRAGPPPPPPGEPLAAPGAAAVDTAGGSGFAAVSVPIAAVRLAQGAGRLIRSASDKGVVAVLDSRLQ